MVHFEHQLAAQRGPCWRCGRPTAFVLAVFNGAGEQYEDDTPAHCCPTCFDPAWAQEVASALVSYRNRIDDTHTYTCTTCGITATHTDAVARGWTTPPPLHRIVCEGCTPGDVPDTYTCATCGMVVPALVATKGGRRRWGGPFHCDLCSIGQFAMQLAIGRHDDGATLAWLRAYDAEPGTLRYDAAVAHYRQVLRDQESA